MLLVNEPPAPDEVEFRAMMRSGSERLLTAIRTGRDEGWPCGHLKTPGNTQTVAGVKRCKECRKDRWLKRFNTIVLARIVKDITDITEVRERVRPAQSFPQWYEPPKERIGIADKLCASVACDFSTSVREMRGESRRKPLVHARAVVQQILKERGWSYPQIARAVGRKDHSTAIHAVSNFDIYARQDELVALSYSKNRGFADAA